MRQIDIFRGEYKISDFITWTKQNSLNLSPDFQRRPVWKLGAKSYLIDTIVRGYPIPIIFLREKRPNLKTLKQAREVIDGQQRLRTIFSFIDPTLVENYNAQKDDFLVQKSHNPEIADKKFHELPDYVKEQILNYQFSVHVLPSDVDDREVIQIFRRMNSTGYKLNSQELRNSEYFGKMRGLMLDLAAEQLNRWRDWGIFNEDDIARMQEVELTSEFAQLMVQGIIAKSQSALDNFYKKYNDKLPFEKEIASRFSEVMDSIDSGLGDHIKDLPFSKKTLFYSLFAYFYDIQYGIKSDLKRKSARPITESVIRKTIQKGNLIKTGKVTKKVEEAIARRTTHASSRNALIEFLHK